MIEEEKKDYGCEPEAIGYEPYWENIDELAYNKIYNCNECDNNDCIHWYRINHL